MVEDFASRVAAAADEMRRKATNREVHTEKLPPEVRMVIDQLIATVNDHEKRMTSVEAFQGALIREATTKLSAA